MPKVDRGDRIRRMAAAGSTLLWLALALAALAGTAELGAYLIAAAPSGWFVQRIVITSPPGDHQPVPLSWPDFGRNTALGAVPVLAVRRDEGGGWSLVPTANMPPLSQRRPEPQRLDGLALETGMVLSGPGFAVEIELAEPDRLSARAVGTDRRLTVTASGETTVVPAPILATCRLGPLAAGWPSWLVALDHWRRRQQQDDTDPVMTWGGSVDCPGRWGIAGLAPDAVGLIRHRRGWTLVPGTAAADLLFSRPPTGQTAPAPPRPAFFSQPIPLALDQPSAVPLVLYLGRLQLAVRAAGDQLHLVPLAGRHRLDWPQFSDDPRLVVETEPAAWMGKPALVADTTPLAAEERLIGSGLAALLGGLAAGLIAWVRPEVRRRGQRGPVVRLVVMTGGLCGGTWDLLALMLAGQSAVGLEAASLAAILLWGLASLSLAWSGYLRRWAGLFWLIVTVLAAFGALVQLQLAAGGTSESVLAVPWKHVLGLSWFAIAVGSFALRTPDAWLRGGSGLLALPQSLVFGTELLVAIVALAGLHALFGWEGGLHFFQPAELFKTLWLVFLSGLGATFLHLVRIGSFGTRWGRVIGWGMGAIVVLTVAILGALAAVEDKSPFVLLLLAAAVWLLVLAARSAELLREAIGPVRFWGRLPAGLALLGCGLAAIGLGMALLIQPPEAWSELIRASDRIAAWVEPERYPVTGEQVTRAQHSLRDLPNLPPLARIVGANGTEDEVPEIENDFVLAFILIHLGRAGGAVLLALQLGLVLSLVAILRRLSWSPGDSDHPPVVLEFLRLLTAGLATLVACHWLIGWANPLGLLPVMGQPSSFLSSGTSHLLFFVLPLCLAGQWAAALTLGKWRE